MSATAQNAIPPLTSQGATAYQYKNSGALSSGGLTIASRNGHRRTLLDVFFEPETVGIFLEVQLGDRLWNRVPTTLGDFSSVALTNKGVGDARTEQLKKQGKGYLWQLHDLIPFDFPNAAQDESIIVTPKTPLGYGSLPGTYYVSALYLDQDTGDVVSKTVPGGSYNPTQLHFNEVTNSASQATTGTTALDSLVNSPGLYGFKDNDITQGGTQFTMYYLEYDGSALSTTTGGNANGKPNRLHITDIDIELFTPEDQEGLLIDRDVANSLESDSFAWNRFVLNTPYVFDENHRVRIQLGTAQKAGAGSNFAANTQFLNMVGIRTLKGATAGP